MTGREAAGPKNVDCTPGVPDSVSPIVGASASVSASPDSTPAGWAMLRVSIAIGAAVTTTASSSRGWGSSARAAGKAMADAMPPASNRLRMNPFHEIELRPIRPADGAVGGCAASGQVERKTGGARLRWALPGRGAGTARPTSAGRRIGRKSGHAPGLASGAGAAAWWPTQNSQLCAAAPAGAALPSCACVRIAVWIASRSSASSRASETRRVIAVILEPHLLEPHQDAGERLGLENRRAAGDDATDTLAAVGPAEEGAVGVHERQVSTCLEPDCGMPRERDLEPECRGAGEIRAVIGVRAGGGEARGAEARREIRLCTLPAAEGQRAADVQVLDVRVVRLGAVVDFRGLARVPELVVAVVALAVAQFQRHRKTRIVLEVAVVAGRLVFEAAAHAIAAVQPRLEQGQLVGSRGGRGEAECGGGEQGAVHAALTIAYGLSPCHCEQESFALRSGHFAMQASLRGIRPVGRCRGRRLRGRHAGRGDCGRTVDTRPVAGRGPWRTVVPRRDSVCVGTPVLPDLPRTGVRARGAAR